MTRPSRAGAGIVVAVALRAAAARADSGTGVQSANAYGAAGVAAGIFDIAFTAVDVARAANGERLEKPWALAEAVGALPQVGVAVDTMASPPPIGHARALAAAWLLWSAALAAHGIWTLATPDTPALRIAPGAIRIKF